jgi:hypothetical protein
LGCPTWSGFVQFLQNVVAVPEAFLPLDNDYVPAAQMCFEISMAVVNPFLGAIPSLYTLAVYNLATDRMINYMTDLNGQTFWEDQRTKYNTNAISLGVVSSGSDQGTGMSQLNPEQMASLTLADLQTLKTPWGRAYMGIAQDYGQTLWGLS